MRILPPGLLTATPSSLPLGALPLPSVERKPLVGCVGAASRLQGVVSGSSSIAIPQKTLLEKSLVYLEHKDLEPLAYIPSLRIAFQAWSSKVSSTSGQPLSEATILGVAQSLFYLLKEDPFSTNRGHWHSLLLQLAASHIHTEENAPEKWFSLFEILSEGLSEEGLIHFLGRHCQVTRPLSSFSLNPETIGLLGPPANEAMPRFSPQEKMAVMKLAWWKSEGNLEAALQIMKDFAGHKSAPQKEIRSILLRSMDCPVGLWRLSRLHELLKHKALAFHFQELADSGSVKGTTWSYLWSLASTEKSPEEMIEAIRGTAHTAYIDDERLSRKVVSVMMWLAPSLRSPTRMEERRAERNMFIQKLMDDGIPLKKAILKLYHHFFRPKISCSEAPYQRMKGHVHIHIGEGQQASYQRVHEETHIHLLGKDMSAAMPMVRDLSHELAHWYQRQVAHQEVQEEGIERMVGPVIVKENVEERLIREIMAQLEEYRDRTLDHPENIFELARITGMTPVGFLRMVNEGV